MDDYYIFKNQPGSSKKIVSVSYAGFRIVNIEWLTQTGETTSFCMKISAKKSSQYLLPARLFFLEDADLPIREKFNGEKLKMHGSILFRPEDTSGWTLKIEEIDLDASDHKLLNILKTNLSCLQKKGNPEIALIQK